MNGRELYLAWLRSTHPMIYSAAMHKLAGVTRSLGGLGQDLLDNMTEPDMQSVTVEEPSLSPEVVSSLNSLSTTSNTTSMWSDIAKAVTSVAGAAIGISAQDKLLQINTQRARLGQAPLQANGQPVTAAQLAPANSSIIAMERSLAGAISPTTLMLGGLGLVALLVLRKRRRA